MVYMPRGVPTPVPDFDEDSIYHTKNPSAKDMLYIYDSPGLFLLNYASLKIGDYGYQEIDFTYTLTFDGWGGESRTITLHVGQTQEITRINDAGTYAQDWQQKRCVVSTDNIPSRTITIDKVGTIVGGSLPIVIASDINN